MNKVDQNWVLMGFIAVLAIALGILWFSGLTGNSLLGNSTDVGVVRIGAILPLSGDFAFVGKSIQQGMILAADEINARGGIYGKPVQILFEDDHYNTPATVSAANKLLNIDRVDAGIVPLLNEAKPIAPLFEAKKVPLIVAWDSTQEIEPYHFVFSTGFSTEEAGKRMAHFAAVSLHAKKVAVVFNQEEWSETISTAFRTEIEKQGGQIVVEESISESESDFRTILSKIKAEKPDVVYAPLTPVNSANFFKQAKELQLTMPLLSADALIPDIIQAAGIAVEGVYFTNFFAEDNSVSKKVIAAYQKRFGKEPDAFPLVAFGYDAVLTLKQAAEKTPTATSITITDAMYLVDFISAGGKIHIQPNGLADRIEKIYQIQNGQAVLVEN